MSHITITIGGKTFGVETLNELRRAIDIAEALGNTTVAVRRSTKRAPKLDAVKGARLTEAQRKARNEASRKAKAAKRKAEAKAAKAAK